MNAFLEPGRRVGLRPASLASLLVALFVVSSAGAADSESEGEPEGWSPAFRVGMGVHVQGLDGNLFSPDSLEPIRLPPTDPLVPDRSSPGAPGDSATVQILRLSLRLYSPEDLIYESRWAPRLFFEGGFELPLDDGFTAARYNADFDSNPTNPNEPLPAVACPEATMGSSCSYSGRATVDILYNWHAAIGTDFRLPIARGQYHLVPRVEYFGQAFDSEGRFDLALTQSFGSEDLRPIRADGGTEILHGIGATLGLEVDVYRGSTIGTRIFVESRAAWILSDRENEFEGRNTVPTVNFNTAEFILRPSSFVVTAAAGIEIRWLGR